MMTLTLLPTESRFTLYASRDPFHVSCMPLAASRCVPQGAVLLADSLATFAAASFDLIVCQHIAGAWSDAGQFLGAVSRLLRPGGQLTLVETVVPGSRLRGKKGELSRRVADYLNVLARLRDPQHGRWLSLDQWQDALHTAGFTLIQHQQRDQLIHLADYVAHLPAPQRLRLQAMIMQAPQPVTAVLTPQTLGDRITFRLGEAIIIAQYIDEPAERRFAPEVQLLPKVELLRPESRDTITKNEQIA